MQNQIHLKIEIFIFHFFFVVKKHEVKVHKTLCATSSFQEAQVIENSQCWPSCTSINAADIGVGRFGLFFAFRC